MIIFIGIFLLFYYVAAFMLMIAFYAVVFIASVIWTVIAGFLGEKT